MKRRNFLKTVCAAAASTALPLPSSPAAWQAAGVGYGAVMGIDPAVAGDEHYVLFMHPKQIEDLRHMEARSRWYEAWGRYRKSLRHGQPEMPARAVLEHFGDAPQWSSL